MKECGWKIYVHRHFFFSPNDNHLSPKTAVDLGEMGGDGWEKESVLPVSPSIKFYSPTWAGRSKHEAITI